MTTKYSVRRFSRYRLTPSVIVPQGYRKSKMVKSINIEVKTWLKLQYIDNPPAILRFAGGLISRCILTLFFSGNRKPKLLFCSGGRSKFALAAVDDLFALGLDVPGFCQRPLGQNRTEEFIVQDRE